MAVSGPFNRIYQSLLPKGDDKHVKDKRKTLAFSPSPTPCFESDGDAGEANMVPIQFNIGSTEAGDGSFQKFLQFLVPNFVEFYISF